MSTANPGKNRRHGFGYILFRLFPIVVCSAPIWVIFDILVSMIHGAGWGIQIIVNQYFFDAVTNIPQGNIQPLIPPTIAFGASMILVQVFNGIGNLTYLPIYAKTEAKIRQLIAKKASRVPAVSYEDTQFLDHLNKAQEGIGVSVMVPVNFYVIFSFYLPFFVVMGLLFYSLKPQLVISLLIVLLPTLFMQAVRSKYYSQLEDQSASIRRRYDSIEKAICSKETFKETRLLGAFGLFRRMYSDSIFLLNAHSWRTEKKTVLVESGLRIVSLIGYVVILYLLFASMMKGEVSIGSFAAVLSGIGQLFSFMEEIIVYHIGNMAKDFGKVRNLIHFLDMPEVGGTEAAVTDQNIQLENVEFIYPGQREKAIKGITLSIHSGETVAVVGENGSGKSTLMRLISGQYLPSAGRIVIGGKDTRKTSSNSLYRQTSAVFQKYQRYAMTLKQNIEISSEKPQNAQEMCRKAGLGPESGTFPDGMDTMLGREFDGVDLSSGQWQRIAIARGICKSHNILLLDEPTAAIDPLEESAMYKQFSNITQGKTAVIATHRLGLVQICDRVVVMQDGRIDDIGTHDELLSRNGLYADMWKAQVQFY